MRYLAILSILLFFPAAGLSTVWYVPDQFTTIQQAINMPLVVNGDTVIVRPGTYVENIDFKGKAITVKSDQGAWLTTIDGGMAGSVVTFAGGEGPNSVLDGFTVRNGSGTDLYPPTQYCCGGGIFCSGSSPAIINNIIRENSVNFFGGGIYCTDVSNPLISRNTISDNFSGDDGAGISCFDTSSPTVSDNVITMNMTLIDAGGIDCWGGCPVIVNNFITDNVAGINAGGIRCVAASPIITNNTICDNSANVNSGGLDSGVACPKVFNTIFWNNTAQSFPQISGGAMVQYCDVEGGWTGKGNINANPLFVAPGDFHLTANSPCVDAGTNAAFSLPLEDFEGDPRCFDNPYVPDTGFGIPPIVDMGADEFHVHLYHTGVTTPGGTVQLKFVGLPGTTQVGLFIGSSVYDPPLPTVYGDWYMKPPTIIVNPLPPIPAKGVYVLPGTLPATPPGPYTFYFQAMIGYRLTNLCTMNIK